MPSGQGMKRFKVPIQSFERNLHYFGSGWNLNQGHQPNKSKANECDHLINDNM